MSRCQAWVSVLLHSQSALKQHVWWLFRHHGGDGALDVVRYALIEVLVRLVTSGRRWDPPQGL